jgi:hypothetical protein
MIHQPLRRRAGPGLGHRDPRHARSSSRASGSTSMLRRSHRADARDASPRDTERRLLHVARRGARLRPHRSGARRAGPDRLTSAHSGR